MNASFSHTWTDEFGNPYFNNRFGTLVPATSRCSGSYPVEPQRARRCNEFTNWNAKFTGTIDAGWGMRVTPVLKMQSGAPYGRYINVPGARRRSRRTA